MPDESQRASLVRQAVSYHHSLPGSPAARYLVEERGFRLSEIEPFRLGYVEHPEPGHEDYRGRLVIPYLRRGPGPDGEWSVAALKFRALPGMSGPKYLGLHGELGKPHLYNTVDIVNYETSVAITEGEIDAVAAHVMVGVPAVGIPGATNWAPAWGPILRSVPRVWILSDGDPAGRSFSTAIRTRVPQAVPVPMPDGEDVNSTALSLGPEWIRERMGLDGPLL